MYFPLIFLSLNFYDDAFQRDQRLQPQPEISAPLEAFIESLLLTAPLSITDVR